MARRPSRRGVLAVALLVALMLLPFLWPYLQALMPVESEASPKPLELMVKAVMHLNSSDTLLSRSVEPGFRVPRSLGSMSRDALDTASQLRAVAAKQPPSRLGLITRNASIAYAHMAEASASMYNASSTLASASPILEEAYRLLVKCRVDEALSKYEEAHGNLSRAEGLLEEAYGQLAETRPQSLLSENHTALLLDAEDDVAGMISAIRESEKLFSLVEAHREAFKHLCSGNLTQSDIQALRETLKSINPGRAGAYGYEEASIASMIEDALQRYNGSMSSGAGQGGQQGQGSQPGSGGHSHSGGPGQGQGAGYGAPSSDD